MSPQEIEAFLEKLTIFPKLTRELLQELAQKCEVEPFAAGELVIQERDIADKLYMVESGRLRAYHRDFRNGAAYSRDKVYEPLDVFKDTWLFQPGNHPYTVEGEQDGRLLTLSSTNFLAFVKEHDLDAQEDLELSEAALTKLPLTFAEKMALLGMLPIFKSIMQSPADQRATPFQHFFGLQTGREKEEEAMTDLAKICEQYSFGKGVVIIHQRDVANKLYIVESGSLVIRSIDENGVTGKAKSYVAYPLDRVYPYFGDIWLFHPQIHAASIKATADGRLLTISSEKFLDFLEKHDWVASRIHLTDKAREEARKSLLAQKVKKQQRGVKLLPGELIEMEKRRSKWLLAVKIVLPLLALFILPLAIYFLLQTTVTTLNPLWLATLSLLPVLLLTPIILFQWIDWANDYLIVTSKRLIRHEYELTKFSGRAQIIPLEQVQSVETDIPNIINKILGLGAVRITTAAQTSDITFDFIRSPGDVEQIIKAIQKEQQSLGSGRYKATMRKSVENYFKIPPPLIQLKDAPPPSPPPPQLVLILRSINKVLTKIFKPYSYRIEDKATNTITYRKHIFALLSDLLWPSTVALIIGLIWFVLTLLGTLDLVVVGFLIFIALMDFAWFIWRFEDWRNDTFQLTNTYVIDVDRLPFGFRESRKTARLDNIQEVQSIRPNLIATILRYGDVDIETAGAQSNITFENVSDPDRIRDDIFKQRDKYQKKQAKAKEERARQQNAVLVDVIREEEELGRIPRRTPDFELPR